MRAKKIKIHRVNDGVMHFDGDPLMAGKELEVEIVPAGLRVIASEKKKENPENPNLLQVISNYFSGLHLKGEEMMAKRQSHLFELNRTLLGKLSKK
jgi:hypothetical protein